MTPPDSPILATIPVSISGPGQAAARWFPRLDCEFILSIAVIGMSSIILYGVFLVGCRAYSQIEEIDVATMEPMGFRRALRGLKDHIMILWFLVATLMILMVLRAAWRTDEPGAEKKE